MTGFNVKILLCALVLAAALGGCDTQRDAVKSLKYFQDSKSGLCFASGTISVYGHWNAVFTWVPCEKVPEHLLEKP